jgi:ribonuclease E
MTKKLLIDAAHAEEVRVAVVEGNHLEEFDSESSSKKQSRSNIYLAKVIRIEPSLQAAFVDYGDDKHGFLPFAEIHPDYYRIPVADRSSNEDEVTESSDVDSEPKDAEEDQAKKNKSRYRYKIQEVIQRRQIILVQVVREQRGNKGAALTTYLSLAGRYCVLMPNAGKRSGGISRKISDDDDRKRLKEVLKGLEIPEGMSLIVRTAGHERPKAEIKRDYDYLIKLWEEIREKTLSSIAPCLVQAEGDLIKRSIRDIYHKEIQEILVEGDQAYKAAKAFMKLLIPSHAKKVQAYKDPHTPLFHKFKVEQYIDQMMVPKVELPSGGSIVINHTEALVSIDVNSGRSTKERNIEVTALKTNLEAAQEIARQLRLRDLAGLVVIDFIDMEDNAHTNSVEKKFKEAIKSDRARIQVGRISQFGLLELSRQRLRPSMMETHSVPCAHCHGTGLIRSTESLALQILRAIEREAIKGKAQEIQVAVPSGVDLYLLNQQRRDISNIENRYQVDIFVIRENITQAPFFKIDTLKLKDIPDVYQEEEPEEEVIKAQKHHKKPKHNFNKKVDAKPAAAETMKDSNESLEVDLQTQGDDAPIKSKNSRYKKRKKFRNNSATQETPSIPESSDSSSIEVSEKNEPTDMQNSAGIIAPQFGKKRKRWNNNKNRSKNNVSDSNPESAVQNSSPADQPAKPKENSKNNKVGSSDGEKKAPDSDNSSVEKKTGKKGNWLRRLLD